MFTKHVCQSLIWFWSCQILSYISPQSKFDQIIIELHGLITMEEKEDITVCLKKLNETHQVIHIHGNNMSSHLLKWGDIIVPECIEVTYVNKLRYCFEEKKADFSLSSLDYCSILQSSLPACCVSHLHHPPPFLCTVSLTASGFPPSTQGKFPVLFAIFQALCAFAYSPHHLLLDKLHFSKY